MRLNPYTADKDAYQHLYGLAGHLNKSTLERTLIDLVEVRISQVNSCAFCLNMHCDSARKHGVDQDKLDVLAGWRESPLFTERERVALALAEEMIRIGDGRRVADETWEAASIEFDEATLGSLIYCIVLINSWNLLNVTTEYPPRKKESS